MRNIVFISSNYPSIARPHVGTFVQQLVKIISRMGVNCAVISPVSIFDIRHGRLDDQISYDNVDGINKVKVIRTKYLSFSSIKLPFYNTDNLTQKSFLMACRRSLNYLDFDPQVIYGHFLYPGAAAAVNIANQLNLPSIAAVGESSFWSVKPLGFQRAIMDFSRVSGVVAVSSEIKRSLINKLMIDGTKISVFPNGVDLSFFSRRNRDEMRNKYNLPQDRFIISFVGHFDERKGPHRLLSAISGMDNVGVLFIGSGSKLLEGENILFKGVVKHSAIPEMLSASDIFVLPTLEEGSCNALIEAMACGLPVVTSKGKFNDDIVDDQTAIRVDPENISEIKNAVLRLQHDYELCRRMSAYGVKRAGELDINLRARKIVSWMEKIIEQQTSGRRSAKIGKICMLSTGHSPLDDRVYYKEALSLSKKYESVFLVMRGDQSEFKEAKNNVKFLPLGQTNTLLSRFLLIPKALIRVFSIRPDVCHFHDFELIIALPILKLLPRCRIIYDVHEVYPEMIMQSKKIPKSIRGLLASSVDVAEKIMSRMADCIVTSDDSITERFYNVHNNVNTVYNYPELRIFIPNEEKLTELRDRYCNKIPIIYQGGISEERGLYLMIRAMEKIKAERPDVILLLVGSMSNHDLHRSKAEINKRNLEDNVKIIGWVSHKDIVNYIHISKIGLVPLLPTPKFMKNVAIKQFEYMACGVPVLGADLPPIISYVTESGSGKTYPAGDSEALAYGVLDILKDKLKWNRMSEAGKKAVQEKWNWNEMEKRLYSVYDELLNEV